MADKLEPVIETPVQLHELRALFQGRWQRKFDEQEAQLKAWQETARREKERADQFKAALFHCVEGWTHGVDVAGPMHAAMRLLKELS